MDIKCTFRRLKIVLSVFFLTVFFASSLYAAQQSAPVISWKVLVFGLLGGLALFLYGIEKISDGLQKSAGNKMRSILAAVTKNRFIGLMVGTFVTMVIQSSSATTVMLVSFVQAGLMNFSQSIGVILGAGIGTTITAQLIAFKLTDYALLMIVIGFGMSFVSKNQNIKNMGELILGFGILFYGMKLMGDAMKPLRTYAGFLNMMKGLEDPMMGILVGTLFTALIQSSSASIGVVIVLAQQGMITLEAGIPLILGANIGTCVTAALASIGTSRDAKRVALAHFIFRVAGVIIFVFWIPVFAELVRSNAVRFGFNMARQIANAHAFFNISLAALFIPFTGYFARFVCRLLPDKAKEPGLEHTTWYLDENSISSPALGIDLARKEISRMAEILSRILRAIIIPFMSDEKLIRKEGLSKEETDLLIKEIPTQDEYFPQLTLFEGIDLREERIDFLDEKVSDYLIQIVRQGVSEELANEVYGMLSISHDIESIGDLIHRNMVPLIQKKKLLEVDFSEEGKEELLIYHQKVCRQIERLTQAFAETDLEKAQDIMSRERKYLDLEEQYRAQHLDRLSCNYMESVKTHEVHMELMNLLKQIVVYSSNIANTFLVKCHPH